MLETDLCMPGVWGQKGDFRVRAMEHTAVDWGDRRGGQVSTVSSEVILDGFMDVVFFANLDINSTNPLKLAPSKS